MTDNELLKFRQIENRVKGRLDRVRGHVQVTDVQSNVRRLQSELDAIWQLDWPSRKDEAFERLEKLDHVIYTEARRLNVDLI